MKKFFVLLIVAVCAALLAGCSEPEAPGLKMRAPDDYKPADTPILKGVYAELGSEYTMDVLSGNVGYYTRVSNNVITNPYGTHFYPVRVANTEFKGSIAGTGGTNRAIGGLGGIQAIVDNLRDTSDSPQTVTTNGAGEFTAPGIIPGDKYEVTPIDSQEKPRGEPVEFTPEMNGDNLGTITLVDGGLNFKVLDYDNNGITIKNTGDVAAFGATYTIIPDFGVTVGKGGGEAPKGVLDTINPGVIKRIDFTMSCPPQAISGDYQVKTNKVIITDPINNKTWNDSFSIGYYKAHLDVHLYFDGYLSNQDKDYIDCLIITPAGTSYRLFTGYGYTPSASVTVPAFTNGNYILVIEGTSDSVEGKYAISIDKSSARYSYDGYKPDMSNFTDTGRYEGNGGNNTEQTAAALMETETFAYLHKGDKDFYKFKVGW